MKISKLSMKNFLGTQDRTLEFGKINSIKGFNGSGKTSIQEAILYALFGKIYGASTNLEKTIYNGSDSMSVVLTVDLDKQYIVERIKTANKTTIKVNGKEVDQSAIDFIFGSYEDFTSKYLAGSFMKFDEGTRYAIINSIFPGDLKKIYEEMVGKEIAEKFPFDTIDEKSIKEKIKEAEGKRDRILHDKVVLSSKIEELSKLEKPESEITEETISVVRVKLSEHESKKPTLKTESTINSEELNLLKGTVASLKVAIKKHQDNKPNKDELNRLSTLYKSAEHELNAIQNGSVCPTCLRAFDKKDIETQTEQAKNKLAQILAEGKVAKTEYENLIFGWEEEDKRLNKDLESKELKIIQLNESVATGNQGAVEHFNKEMELWNTRFIEINTELNDLSNKYKEFLIHKTNYESSIDSINEYKNKLGELDKELQSISFDDLVKVKECFGAKGIEFKDIESKIEKIRGFLPEGVELELIQQNKTNDGFKKVFNLSQNGVGYNWLSKGMKKILDIHLCDMLGGGSLLIIDDLESLTSSVQLTKDEAQVITLTASPCEFTFEKQ